MTRARPGPGHLIRIGELLEADDGAAAGPRGEALRARDRALGRSLSGLAARPAAQVTAWMLERDRQEGGPGPTGAMGAVSAACAAVGAFAGVTAALGAFFYDGAGRVNVLLLLALFVGLPLVTLALFAAAAASRGRLTAVNPGRLGTLVTRVLPAGGARELGALATGARGPGVARWLALCWSQWMGLGFGLGALATALALVVFTDLAFGWSTTLDVAPESVQRVSRALALPWRGVLPAAVPDRELVEASRYFRIAAARPPVDPALPGRWWSFVVLAMLAYGVAPRLVTVPLARWRLSRACAEAMLADPRVHELLDRMNTPLVETRSPEAESRPDPGPAAEVSAALPPAKGWQVVSWAALPLEPAPVAVLLGGARLLGMHPAGGARRTGDDRDLARRLGDTAPGDGILVLARAFEPPTLDLVDFLAALRAAAPAAVPVIVLPLGLRDGAPVPAQPTEESVWRRALARGGVEGVHAARLSAADTP